MSLARQWREQRAEAILEAANRVVARRGLDSTTLAEIASEAGVAKGTLYLHYRCKRTMLAALADREARHALEVVHRVASSAHGAMEQLHHVFRSLSEGCRADRSLPILLTPLTHPQLSDTQTPAGELVQSIAQIVAHGQATGEIHPGTPPEIAALVVLSLALAPDLLPWLGPSDSPESFVWMLLARSLTGRPGDAVAADDRARDGIPG